MVATLGGLLALPLGLAVLLLPLLATELSRPRDSAWGALVLLLGLVLVTSADRLSGAPMLGVVCAALLIGRLGLEVGLGRWRQLSDEERHRLGSAERWGTSLRQLGATLAGAGQQLAAAAGGLSGRLGRGRAGAGPGATGPGGRARAKRWVRPDPVPAAEPASAAVPTATHGPAAAQSIAPPSAEPEAEPEAESEIAKTAAADSGGGSRGETTGASASSAGLPEGAAEDADGSPEPAGEAAEPSAPAATTGTPPAAEPGLEPPAPQP